MARCDVPECDWYGTKAGKPIHMARMHGIHRVETVELPDPNPVEELGTYPDLPEMHEPEVVRW